jgi:hypothetical protein
VFATLDEAKAFRDGFIQAHLINEMVYVSEKQSVLLPPQHSQPVSLSL